MLVKYKTTTTYENYLIFYIYYTTGGYRIATGLKKRMPGLRILISVGGEGTERLFSELVQKPTYRRAFVESAVSFLKEHDFDGLDLHWVYAGQIFLSNKDY